MKAKNKLLMVFTFTLATLSLNAQEQKASQQEPIKKVEVNKKSISKTKYTSNNQGKKPVQKIVRPEMNKVAEKEVREKQ